MSGLAEYKNNYKIVRPYDGQAVDDDFVAMTCYEKDNTVLEVLYKGEGHQLETLLYYNSVLRFDVPELLSAARKNAISPRAAQGLSSPTQITETVSRLAEDFEKHAKLICNPPVKLLERAQTIRVKHMEQTIRKFYADTVNQAVTLAAKAYREKDYKGVVALLEPHKNHLSPSDLKKLQLAKKQLLS